MFMIVVTFSVLIYNILLDIPYAIYVETCLAQERDPRPVTRFNLIAVRTGVIFNACSVVMDVLMVRFIKQTILPTAVTTTIHIQMPNLQEQQTTNHLVTGPVENGGKKGKIFVNQ